MFSGSASAAPTKSANAETTPAATMDLLIFWSSHYLLGLLMLSGAERLSTSERRDPPRHRESLVQVRRQFETKSGAGRNGDETVLYLGQCRHQIAIPGPVVGADALLHQGVRRVERQMGRSSENHRTCAVVRRDRQMPCFGHRGDFLGFGNASAPGDIQHHYPRDARLQQVPEREPASQRFRRANGRDRRLRVAFQRAEAVHLDRVFVPESIKRRERARDRHRRQQLPHRVKLDHDIHLVANGVSDLLERNESGRYVLRRDIAAVRLLSGVIERPYLHGRYPLAQQLGRQLVSAIEKAVEIVIFFPLTGANTVVGRRLSGRLAHVSRAGAGVVGADLRTRKVSEQLREGLPGDLAEYVPERDVERGIAAHFDAGRTKSEVAREILRNSIDFERVAAE